MRKVFASYHWTSKDAKMNGFGNYLGEFEEDAYSSDPRQFVLDLEETIAKQLSEKLKFECQVKVMFFK